MPTSMRSAICKSARVARTELEKGDTFEVSVEGFYKDYDKIPLSVADGIPLTCKGNDYGVIGNELLTSTAQGRSYGAELLLKWLVAKKLNLASSFTLFKSEYRTDKESEYIASAWTTALFSTCGELTISPGTGASE